MSGFRNYYGGFNSSGAVRAIAGYAANRDTLASGERMMAEELSQRDAHFQKEFDENKRRWDEEWAEILLDNNHTRGIETARNDAEVRNLDASSREIDANVGQIKANTRETNTRTDASIQARKNAATRRVGGDIVARIQRAGGVPEFFASGDNSAYLRQIASMHPDYKAWVALEHDIDPDTARVAAVGNSGQNVIAGTSKVNGQPTVGTTRRGVLAEGAEDGAYGPTNEELLTWIMAKYVTAGGTSPAATDLLVRANMSPEEAADTFGNMDRIRTATADAATGVATLGGSREDIANAAAGIGTSSEQVKSNIKMTEREHEEGLRQRGDLADAYLADPNRDLKIKGEREAILSGRFNKRLDKAVEKVTDRIDVSQDVHWFLDRDYESIRRLPPEQRKAALTKDFRGTVDDPEQRAVLEYALGKSMADWSDDDMFDAFQLVAIQRRGDEENDVLWNLKGLRRLWGEHEDVRTHFTVTPEAIERYREGLRANNLTR